MDTIQKMKRYKREAPNFRESISPKILENRVALSVLRDLEDRVEKLQGRVSKLESSFVDTSNIFKDYIKKNQDTMNKPEIQSDIRELTSRIENLEKRFDEETQEGDEVIEEILSEVKKLIQKPETSTNEKNLTIVEQNRVDKITSLLKNHEKLSSSELSQLIGLSRTRCNEYFKMMENLDLVTPERRGRKKFYKLKT